MRFPRPSWKSTQSGASLNYYVMKCYGLSNATHINVNNIMCFGLRVYYRILCSSTLIIMVSSRGVCMGVGRAMGVRLLGTIHLEIVEIGSCNYWEIIDGV